MNAPHTQTTDIKDLKLGNILIEADTRYSDYVVVEEARLVNGTLAIQLGCPSLACIWFTQEEVDAQFKNVWAKN